MRLAGELALVRGSMGNNEFDLVILSDCVLDIYYRVGELPIKVGDIAVSDIIALSPGGACTTALVTRKLGLNVAVIDKVGDDPFSDILIKYLNDNGIHTGFIKRVHGFVTISNNIITNNGHAFMGYLGVGRELTVDDIDENIIKNSRAIYINGFYASFTVGIVNTFIETIRTAHKHSVQVFLDVGPAINNRDLIISLIGLSNTVFMNEDEMKRLFGDLENLTNFTGSTGIIAIVKLGSRGAALVRNGKIKWCKSYDTSNIVTTIGAGDTFNAAYITGIIRDLDPVESCNLGNRIAFLRTQHLTPMELPEIREIIK
ncbi:MAG: carbohydrate kinase family protein [Vulcanisaeta sp.]|uniref:carbohydrate kinase family protein n=1 Tax=Vulcanisaeta sp. TaxID=2020871 RepID=UPI003D0DF1D3